MCLGIYRSLTASPRSFGLEFNITTHYYSNTAMRTLSSWVMGSWRASLQAKTSASRIRRSTELQARQGLDGVRHFRAPRRNRHERRRKARSRWRFLFGRAEAVPRSLLFAQPTSGHVFGFLATPSDISTSDKTWQTARYQTHGQPLRSYPASV